MRRRSNPDSEPNIRRIDTKARAKKQTHGFQVQLAIVRSSVETNEFIPGALRCWKLGDPSERNIDSKFLAKFAGGALVVLFAGINMPRGAGSPGEWMSIFPARAQLEEEVPGWVENEDVDRPVEQVIRMHFAPGSSPLDAV